MCVKSYRSKKKKEKRLILNKRTSEINETEESEKETKENNLEIKRTENYLFHHNYDRPRASLWILAKWTADTAANSSR